MALDQQQQAIILVRTALSPNEGLKAALPVGEAVANVGQNSAKPE